MEQEIEKLKDQFCERFASVPRFFQAPGRVNLIGEHTDYNDGFVMPFAIDRRTIAAAAARKDTTVNVYAADMDESATFDLSDQPQKKRGTWMDYVEGSARCVAERFGASLSGADLIITSTVPMGAGLSSSAAIEIAVGYALLSVNDIAVDLQELAFAAQKAEHEFVGTRSGIMDQFAAVFGKSRNAMLLDCRSFDIDYVPIADGETVVAAIDTKVKHNLASSEYNTRRGECESGVAILQKHDGGVTSLRDVTMEMLDEHGHLLPENILRRCRHVVSENARTVSAAEAFRKLDYTLAGELMLKSHDSLRDDYEVSCAELDLLVATAKDIRGVYGARMTGGGFGGCTVNLVDKSAVEKLKDAAINKYSEAFGFEPDFYVFQAANGASEVTG